MKAKDPLPKVGDELQLKISKAESASRFEKKLAPLSGESLKAQITTDLGVLGFVRRRFDFSSRWL